MQSGTLAASVPPAKFARLDWDSCLCHNALDRSISDSEPLALFTERSSVEIASACRCPPQGPHNCFPSAARTVLTSLCLVECIIASATNRVHSQAGTGQVGSATRRPGNCKRTMSRTMTTVSNCRYRYRARTSNAVSKEVRENTLLCSDFRRCAEQIPSRRLVVLRVAK